MTTETTGAKLRVFMASRNEQPVRHCLSSLRKGFQCNIRINC